MPQTTRTIAPRRTLAAPKLGWSYEIDVALPPSFAAGGDKPYPVLWVTGGAQMWNDKSSGPGKG